MSGNIAMAKKDKTVCVDPRETARQNAKMPEKITPDTKKSDLFNLSRKAAGIPGRRSAREALGLGMEELELVVHGGCAAVKKGTQTLTEANKRGNLVDTSIMIPAFADIIVSLQDSVKTSEELTPAQRDALARKVAADEVKELERDLGVKVTHDFIEERDLNTAAGVTEPTHPRIMTLSVPSPLSYTRMYEAAGLRYVDAYAVAQLNGRDAAEQVELVSTFLNKEHGPRKIIPMARDPVEARYLTERILPSIEERGFMPGVVLEPMVQAF